MKTLKKYRDVQRGLESFLGYTPSESRKHIIESIRINRGKPTQLEIQKMRRFVRESAALAN